MGNISSVLKSRRKELGLTLAQIAAQIGVTEATVQRWESGNIKSLRHERIAKLAEILGVAPAVLMGWDEPGAPELPSPAITKSLIHNLPTAPQLLPDEQQLLSDYRNFNDEGQEKVRDYVEDLKDSPKYKKCSAPCMEKQA